MSGAFRGVTSVPISMKSPISGRKLALVWILAVSLNTVLALYTFKLRLVSEGMAADQALARASVWEAVHVFAIVGLIPGCVVVATWAYLRSQRVADWTAKKIVIFWLLIPMVFYFVVLAEGVVTETILPLDNNYLSPRCG